jgi:hypothetical protein
MKHKVFEANLFRRHGTEIFFQENIWQDEGTAYTLHTEGFISILF